MTAVEQWREELAGWALPAELEQAAEDPPWGFPVELFRAEPQPAYATSRRVALAALPDGGSVLDVGCGGGTASLALVPPAGHVTGVDDAPGMLTEFAAAADRAGVAHSEVAGRWPDVSAQVPVADVVVCHHVLYNVPDLEPFVAALAAHARRRVVVELTAQHPMTASRPLWTHFHGLARPDGPTADLAADALRELGVDVRVERDLRPPRDVPRSAYVALYRRRLCLPRGAEPQVDAVLGATDAPREIATLWWDRPG